MLSRELLQRLQAGEPADELFAGRLTVTSTFDGESQLIQRVARMVQDFDRGEVPEDSGQSYQDRDRPDMTDCDWSCSGAPRG